MGVSGPVLLFDGECGLCVQCARLLLKADREQRLRFAPLQGGVAHDYLETRGLPTADFDSVVFVPDWARRLEMGPLLRSDALLGALHAIGGRWRLFSGLRIFPRMWRDAGYRVVAKWRRRVFGEGDVAILYKDFGPERFLK
jgi:predicted DCC family thiol-disulfide oxidoreductase YuxK